MELSKYIKDILISRDNVIIPNFGAFEKTMLSARIDPKTGEVRAPSGTAEEILQALNPDKKPIGMIYFYNGEPDLTNANIAAEWQRLEQFKKRISNKMIYKLYDREDKILEQVCRNVCDLIRSHTIFAAAWLKTKFRISNNLNEHLRP